MPRSSIYTDEEIGAMIALRKEVELEALESRRKNRQGADNSFVIPLEPIGGTGSERFELEVMRNPLIRAHTYTLKGQLVPRSREAIVRYSIDASDHENPPGIPPPEILAGTPHCHRRSRRSEVDLGKWDAIAEPVELRASTANDLFGKFLTDMNIHVRSTDDHQALFDFVNDNG